MVAPAYLENKKGFFDSELFGGCLADGGCAFPGMQRAEEAASGETLDFAGEQGIGGGSGSEGVAFDGPTVVVAPFKVGEDFGCRGGGGL